MAPAFNNPTYITASEEAQLATTPTKSSFRGSCGVGRVLKLEFLDVQPVATTALATTVATTTSSRPPFSLTDDNLILRTGLKCFRVSRAVITNNSAPFRALCAMEPTNKGPMVLSIDSVEPIDIERFLGVIYSRRYDRYDATTVEEWTSVLEVSTWLDFQSIKSLAINKLELIADPVDEVVLGRQYGVHVWLKEAYMALCRREEKLTIEEGKRLGVEDVVRIAGIREGPSLTREDLRAVVNSTFSLPARATLNRSFQVWAPSKVSAVIPEMKVDLDRRQWEQRNGTTASHCKTCHTPTAPTCQKCEPCHRREPDASLAGSRTSTLSTQPGGSLFSATVTQSPPKNVPSSGQGQSSEKAAVQKPAIPSLFSTPNVNSRTSLNTSVPGKDRPASSSLGSLPSAVASTNQVSMPTSLRPSKEGQAQTPSWNIPPLFPP